MKIKYSKKNMANNLREFLAFSSDFFLLLTLLFFSFLPEPDPPLLAPLLLLFFAPRSLRIKTSRSSSCQISSTDDLRATGNACGCSSTSVADAVFDAVGLILMCVCVCVFRVFKTRRGQIAAYLNLFVKIFSRKVLEPTIRLFKKARRTTV